MVLLEKDKFYAPIQLTTQLDLPYTTGAVLFELSGYIMEPQYTSDDGGDEKETDEGDTSKEMFGTPTTFGAPMTFAASSLLLRLYVDGEFISSHAIKESYNIQSIVVIRTTGIHEVRVVIESPATTRGSILISATYDYPRMPSGLKDYEVGPETEESLPKGVVPPKREAVVIEYEKYKPPPELEPSPYPITFVGTIATPSKAKAIPDSPIKEKTFWEAIIDEITGKLYFSPLTEV